MDTAHAADSYFRRGEETTNTAHACRRTDDLLPILAFWLIVALVSLTGCSNRLESEVSGWVTLDGKTLGPGAVVFAAVGDTHTPAIGSIQPDGSYFLNTGRTTGLLPGKYRVSVYIHEMPPGAKPTDRQASTRSLIPEKYEAIETSGLEFNVQPGSNTIHLELVSL